MHVRDVSFSVSLYMYVCVHRGAYFARISNTRAIVRHNGRYPWGFCFFLLNLRTAKTRLVLSAKEHLSSARIKRGGRAKEEERKERTKGMYNGDRNWCQKSRLSQKILDDPGLPIVFPDGRGCRRLNNSWAFVARWIPTKYLVTQYRIFIRT